MNGTVLLVIGVVVLVILAVVVIRSVRGPKAEPVNPFGVVSPSRAPVFPDSVSQPAAVASTAVESDSQPEEEPAELEQDMKIPEYVAQAEQEVKDGELDEAIDSIGEAITLAQVEFGGDSVEVAQLLIKQGEVYQLRDYQDSADDINCIEYCQALAILEQRYGAESEELLPVLRLLVSWYYQTGDQQNADTLIRRSQSIVDAVSEAKRAAAESTDGSAATSPAVANAVKVSPFKVAFTSSDETAVDSCKEGDEAFAAAEYDDAVTAFQAAIDSVQSELGRSAPELVQLFQRLGRTYQVKDAADRDEEGDAYTDAADNYQIALSMLVKAHGFDAAVLAPVLLDLASFEDQRGEHYKAESYLRRLAEVERIARSKQ